MVNQNNMESEMPGQCRAFTISFLFWIKKEILLWINRKSQMFRVFPSGVESGIMES